MVHQRRIPGQIQGRRPSSQKNARDRTENIAAPKSNFDKILDRSPAIIVWETEPEGFGV
jgi:hypothetical protein